MKRLIKFLPILIMLPLVMWGVFGGATASELDRVFLDGDGSVYFVSKNEGRFEFVRASSDGQLRGRCEIKRFDGVEFFQVYSMAFGDNAAYCVVGGVHSVELAVTRLIWYKLDFRTGRARVIDEQAFDKNPINAQLEFGEDGLRNAVIFEDGVLIWDANKRVNIDLSGEIINGAGFYKNGELLITNTFGELFLTEGERVERLLSVPSFFQFKTDSLGNAYFYQTVAGWRLGEVRDGGIAFSAAGIEERSLVGGQIWTKDNYVAINEGDAVLYQNGERIRISVPRVLPVRKIFTALLIWVLLSAGFVLCLIVYKKIPTVSILLKQAVIIIAVFGIGVYVLAGAANKVVLDKYKQSVVLTMRTTVEKKANAIDLNKLADIDWQAAKGGYYHELRERLIQNSELGSLIDISSGQVIRFEGNYYVNMLVMREGRLYAVIYDNQFINTPIEYVWGDAESDYYSAVLSQGLGVTSGLDGVDEWTAMVVPLVDANGEVVAYLECGISMLRFESEVQQIVTKIIAYIAVAIFVAIAVLTAGLWLSLRHLKNLTLAVDGLGRGERLELKVKGKDEISKISSAFIRMAEEVSSRTLALEELNHAYCRFLPLELLRKLDKESALGVKKGDFALVETIILYVAIADFDAVADKYNADAAFRIFNSISEAVTKSVSECGGITESISQAGFVCLFEREGDAYNAYLLIRNILDEGDFAFSLVRGEVLIGIAGNENRLCTVAVSKSTRLARSLADEARLWGAGLISNTRIEDVHLCRYLGRLGAEKLFECFEGDEIESVQSKDRLSELFSRGVDLFEQGLYRESKAVFIEYLKVALPDAAARRYLLLCEKNLNKKKAF